MRRHTTVVLFFLGLSGCAELTHLTRNRDAGGVQYILIDAKQRAIAARGGVSCAEPSPDALSALAASQGLSLSTPNGSNLAQSFALAEAAGSIGLRTQSIQLMRDHMFRVCEAYQSGQIGSSTAALLQRRFQTTVVAILAIEQLTGTVRPPSIVLGTSASIGDAEAIAKLSDTRAKQSAAVDAAKGEFDTKVAAVEAAEGELAVAESALAAATDENRAALEKARNEKQQKLVAAKEDQLNADGKLASTRAALAAVDRALALASATGSASGSGAIEATSSARSGDISAIADSVEKIVAGTYGLGNKNDLCMVILADAARDQNANPNNPVIKECIRFLEVMPVI